MSYVRQCHWTPKLVMVYLEEAAAIHHRLPEVRVAGYRTLWPETLKDEWSRLYDSTSGMTKLGSPMPREVSYHEEIMGWLRWVEHSQQQILWMRANHIPWKIIEHKFDKARTTLWRKQSLGLERIAAMLSSQNDPGDLLD